MRTIKFRAKIVIDVEPLAMKRGLWVEGHYYEDLQDGEWYSWIQECNDTIHYKVDKNTLGQFTGLLDKNGKEIYEGDILGWKWNYKEIKGIDIECKSISYICFEDSEWKCKDLHGNSVNLSSLAEILKLEIIGNIHDNPELLKGCAE